jgi:hypothetical protein
VNCKNKKQTTEQDDRRAERNNGGRKQEIKKKLNAKRISILAEFYQAIMLLYLITVYQT